MFTSRNYIWEAARPHLKTSAFPLLKESQIVVNVHALSEQERAQMLYNHVRRIQPQAIRRLLKPHLSAIAANKAFCRRPPGALAIRSSPKTWLSAGSG
ncbi:hypothetical protein [Brevundimonas denitrificans]|uniref:nSTAND3 domain-containing NTPase n=1 Tax=Brevundimonas denitrificans TaxID=1443434 RepID=UPI00352E567D